MPVSDLTDADIDAVYSMISPAHGIDTLKENRRAQLARERPGHSLAPTARLRVAS